MPTDVEWADETWNPLLGCFRISGGCDFCYAIRTAKVRSGHPNRAVAEAFAGLVERRNGRLDWTGKINLMEERLTQPLRWRKPRKVFVNALSDLFHDAVPVEFIARVFAVMAATPQHTYQILTKRHGRMRSLLRDECQCHASGTHFRSAMEWAATPHSPTYVPGLRSGLHHRMTWPLPNVWIGVSVEDQKTADLRIPALLETPAAVRWLSMEPLIGPVDLFGEADAHGHRGWPTHWLTGRPTWGTEEAHPNGMVGRPLEVAPRVDWVVAGGESGPGARPMKLQWARTVRDQCVTAQVPFFFKQWGAWVPVSQMPEDTFMSWDIAHGTSAYDRDQPWRVGKKAAGRLLDERIWDEYPAALTGVAAAGEAA
ncbi:DUF5131 family protein [Micromonospora sp. NPDC049366]|uniref:DUF5131 family protein n=1 Tax=Micromonospora sp. NPDC049366 TaxID=3364271 RepID=UPI00379DAFBA